METIEQLWHYMDAGEYASRLEAENGAWIVLQAEKCNCPDCSDPLFVLFEHCAEGHLHVVYMCDLKGRCYCIEEDGDRRDVTEGDQGFITGLFEHLLENAPAVN